MMKYNQIYKNRGAISNPEGRFETTSTEQFYDGWELEEEILPPFETLLMPEKSKTIISRNDSPDLGFEQSINPYRGCEHGCIYCYARPSHAYVNLSPGLDFETKIFYKAEASEILKKELNKPRYMCQPIILGANTDPYQPAEAKLKITRSLLEIFNLYQHPVIIITKSSLIERDIDILQELAHKNLVRVAISITTLSRNLKHIMEPRTTPLARLNVVNRFTKLGIPVNVMVAPVIPRITDQELEHILQAASEAGAKHAYYVLIRLPYEVKDLFEEWLARHFLDRAAHVMSLIRQMRGGKEYDSKFGARMRGEGEYANLLASRFKLACKRYQLNVVPSLKLDIHRFKPIKLKNETMQQLNLWDE
jgi:DNA repair photolyase